MENQEARQLERLHKGNRISVNLEKRVKIQVDGKVAVWTFEDMVNKNGMLLVLMIRPDIGDEGKEVNRCCVSCVGP